MANDNIDFAPDYAVPPGAVLDEHIDARGLSHAEFARRCGRSAKHISEIIGGKAPVEPDTALQFERVLGLPAHIWLGLEKDYRLMQARADFADEAESDRGREWFGKFPVRELKSRGVLKPESDAAAGVSDLLSFFGVGSITAWENRYAAGAVAFRKSEAFDSDSAALSCWLREGEAMGEGQECGEYNEQDFRAALKEIRDLTREDIRDALPKVADLLNACGVAFALVQEYKKISISGAARWLGPRRALIQLSARHKSDDHLWFSFYHEAAHIFLHSKKKVFVDYKKASDSQEETEANDWAANFLIPNKSFEAFVRDRPISRQKVRVFARELGIAPGIVVGRLQHTKSIPWSQMNDLKVRYEWVT